MPTGKEDPSLDHFNLTDAGRNMVRWLQKMMETAATTRDEETNSQTTMDGSDKPADITLLGSIWSPPQWMKQDNTLRIELVWQSVLVDSHALL